MWPLAIWPIRQSEFRLNVNIWTILFNGLKVALTGFRAFEQRKKCQQKRQLCLEAHWSDWRECVWKCGGCHHRNGIWTRRHRKAVEMASPRDEASYSFSLQQCVAQMPIGSLLRQISWNLNTKMKWKSNRCTKSAIRIKFHQSNVIVRDLRGDYEWLTLHRFMVFKMNFVWRNWSTQCPIE